VNYSDQTQGAQKDVALQKCTVVAKQEMVRSTDGDPQAFVGRHAIVDGLDVGHDRAARGIRRVPIVGEQKHEWVRYAFANHSAQRRTIDIDAGVASGIVVAELGDGRTAEGMTKNSDTAQVKTPGEPSRAI